MYVIRFVALVVVVYGLKISLAYAQAAEYHEWSIEHRGPLLLGLTASEAECHLAHSRSNPTDERVVARFPKPEDESKRYETSASVTLDTKGRWTLHGNGGTTHVGAYCYRFDPVKVKLPANFGGSFENKWKSDTMNSASASPLSRLNTFGDRYCGEFGKSAKSFFSNEIGIFTTSIPGGNNHVRVADGSIIELYHDNYVVADYVICH